MIITLTGASGTGKTTIARTLMERLPNALPLMSYTTRSPRPNDLPGDFSFISKQEFDEIASRDEFLWTAKVGDTRYATKKEDLKQAFADEGAVRVMILVPERLPNVHAFAKALGMSNHVLSFAIASPGTDILLKRMRERGDDEMAIEKRIAATADFEEKARTAGVPLVWIQDEGDLDKKVSAVLRRIKSS